VRHTLPTPPRPADLATRAIERLLERTGGPAFRLVSDGAPRTFGRGDPRFTLTIRRPAAARALASLDALAVAHAYLDGDFDLDGDLVAALGYQEQLGDFHPWIYLWRRLEPLLLGRPRVNPDWIALHYDAENAQLHAVDRDYQTYTPGIYLEEDDSLESGAARKLERAFGALDLRDGQRLLEVGSGWGGMLRYAARRGVAVTGLTLSRVQRAHCEALIARERLPAEVRYQDFFTFAPERRFDAISLMGVIEDLSDYRAVAQRLARWVVPGGRVYLDFAAERERFGTHSFVTRHVWPGTFRMVFLPELIEALRESPFEIVSIDNDRRNYHLWTAGVYRRWVEERAAVVAAHGERLWRTFCLLFAGVAAMMDRRSHSATAYRVVLELPADSDGAFRISPRQRIADRLRGTAARLRDGAVSLFPRRS
jgi:cyclopropane-fatty-acyl-phospholipid synthase